MSNNIQPITNLVIDDLEAFVLCSLKRQQNIQDNLIPEVIERTGWSWPKAEEYISQVQSKNQLSITLWQGRLYTYLSILFGVGGLALILISLGISLNMEKILPCIVSHIGNSNILSFKNCIELNLESLQSMNSYLLLGIGLILGGIVGSFFAFRQLRNEKIITNS